MLLCLALLASAIANAQDANPNAPTVTAIEIRTDETLARRLDFGRFPAFAVGDPLTPEAIRRTLSNAHASGLFAEIELLTRPDPDRPDAVVAILVLRGYVRLRHVDVEVAGSGAGSRGKRARRELRLRAGQILDEDRLQVALDKLRDAWLARGFQDVFVDAGLVPTGEPKRVDLRVVVVPGVRPTVSEIRFDGLSTAADLGLPTTLDSLREALRLPAGDPWRPDRLDDARRRLRRELVDLGHLAARVDEPRTEILSPGEAVVVFPVSAGPKIEVEIVGADEKKLRRRGLLPFFGDRPFDVDLLRASADDIRRHFQEKGYRRTRVQWERLTDAVSGKVAGEEAGGVERWRITVETGDRWLLRDIVFEGNESVRSADLRSLLGSARQRWLEPGSGRLVDEQLASDLDTIRSYYLLEGFSQVQVGPHQIGFDESSDAKEPGSLTLRIPILEGPRQRVVNLELRGIAALGEDEIRRRLALRPGGPFHPLLLDEALDVVRALYEDEGYRAATVAAALDWNDDRTLVDVTLEVDEGPQTRIDRLVLRGLVRTRPDIVRAFADLETGEPLNRRGLLRAERDLYRLGVFSRVEVEPAPSGPTPPTDGVRHRDVLIDVEEGSLWRISYGASFHSDDGIGGLFGLTRSHIAGRAARLQLDLRASENDRRARLVFDDPSLLRRRLPLTWSLFLRDEERPSYSVEEAGAQIALIRDTGRFRWGVTWDYRLVEISGLPDLAGLEREDREVEISSLTPNFFYDRRDDPLDPSRGGSTALQLEVAFPALDAETEFAKLFLQQTWHHSLGRAGVLAWSARLGAIEPSASAPDVGPLLDPSLPSARVPISERFFGGGRTSHRAYERDALGLLGETLVEASDGRILQLGGNGLLLANFDYRFPIAGDFGGVLWSDVGNVWADWRDVRADELRTGLGLGLRYRSPIGPVRMEVGWKLDRQPFEESGPVFFLSFGNPF